LNPEADSHRHQAVCKREVRAGQQGRRDEARAMLADIYGWFTEVWSGHEARNGFASARVYGCVAAKKKMFSP
jgi:hypothetical protein